MRWRLILFLLAGCAKSITLGGECKTNSECQSGLICSAQTCERIPCGSANGCLKGQTCESDGLCHGMPEAGVVQPPDDSPFNTTARFDTAKFDNGETYQ